MQFSTPENPVNSTITKPCNKGYALRLLLLSFCLLTCSVGAQGLPVTVGLIEEREFTEQLRVQGNIDSASIARVSPRIPGPIDAIFVKEGDSVVAGKTRLFVIDPVKLEKNLEIRRQESAIARLSLKEKEARLKQAQADLEKAKLDVDRSRLLWEENSTSQDNYEKAQLKFKVSEATLEHTQTLIELDREQLKKAQLGLGIAEKDFADSTVLAPISGRVSSKLQEAGEIAAPGKPILLIKDLDNLEVSAFIPAEYYHRVEVGKCKAIISSYANARFQTTVSFKSPEISPDLRTFQIKCTLQVGDNSMVPGALAEITLILANHRGLAVPVSSLLNRGQGKVIFVVDSDRARMIEVSTGLETDGFCEISAGGLKAGQQVVIKGQNLLNDGQEIQPQKDAGAGQ
ncbi:MAG TPA: efflux RND transporter periplasmic adaptor subunit [Candidatus Rifleibacterium sp.]|nr:efflux RND transporter periplasmic adaptor subunit [Candidatus Rifleibacterium sp.]HPT45268.1 efflux RND transporter periplasmic adaptor subunit [Candidatus Rifleibacterium sp.]